ncbi:glycosyltransferase family 2 protein [Stella sp.]|uniref:glycosyltransferase family 2 protein n=1 Tax=Stella sp. TaxID=2912054 RepID=UPI0035AE563F
MARAGLAIGAVFRNEAPYLAEWLAFHARMGVDAFFLYDNDSTDDWRAAVAASGQAGRTTVLSCPGPQGQVRAYRDCLERFRDAADWIAFVDLDEFLFAPDGRPLPTVLEAYRDRPGVAVNWMVFGTGGHATRPAGLVTQSYVRRGATGVVVPYHAYLKGPGLDPRRSDSYRPMNSHVKSIVRPRVTLRAVTPHHFAYADGRFAVTEDGVPIDGPWSATIGLTRLRINHYWSKSQAELEAKTARGVAWIGQAPSLDFNRSVERLMNAETDTTILPLARGLPGWRPLFGAAA